MIYQKLNLALVKRRLYYTERICLPHSSLQLLGMNYWIVLLRLFSFYILKSDRQPRLLKRSSIKNVTMMIAMLVICERPSPDRCRSHRQRPDRPQQATAGRLNQEPMPPGSAWRRGSLSFVGLGTLGSSGFGPACKRVAFIFFGPKLPTFHSS